MNASSIRPTPVGATTRAYEHSPEALREQLGDTLVRVNPIPAAFASTMGDTAYLLRHPRLEPLLDAIGKVQQPRLDSTDGQERATPQEPVGLWVGPALGRKRGSA